MAQFEITVAIPARYDSNRFPGKALAKIKGKEMILRVFERCFAWYPTYVVTDDTRIKNCIDSAVPMCSVMVPDGVHSGTDRIALAVLRGEIPVREGGVVVNVQGDQPLVQREHIDTAVEALIGGSHIDKTVVCGSVYKEDHMNNDPNTVKVVTDCHDLALYFSRAPIPVGGNLCKKHIGVYALTVQALTRFHVAQYHGLEMDERLEQLRILENGMRIGMKMASVDSPSVNTPEDVAAIEAAMGDENG